MDDDMKIVPDPAEEKEAATELDGQTAFEEVIDSGTLPPDETAAEEAPAIEEYTETELFPETSAEEAESAEEPAAAAEEDPESEDFTKVFSVDGLAENAEPKLDGKRLAAELCRAVMEAVGENGFHGGIRPDNISLSSEKVTLGSPLEHGVGEFTPQELEYMAPELFWDGKRGSEADVYSLGLVLYSLYNHGQMPFWPEDEDASPNLRAAALQKRMSREPVPAPAGAGEALSAIILKALSFSAQERWKSVGELLTALEGCDEQQADPADLAGIAAAMSVRSASQHREAPDEMASPFVGDIGTEKKAPVEEEPIPRVKVRRTHRRLAQVIVYLVLAASIIAIVLLLRRCAALDEAARVTPTPPSVEAMQPSEQEKIINGNLSENAPAPEGEQSEETESGAEAEAETAPEAEPIIEYTVYQENVSWSEAVARCKELGGTLAMPTNYGEFQEITDKCREAGLTFVWLNAHRDENDNWVNADGELAAYFFAWADGEPSYKDAGDGAAEDYYLLWNMGGRWSGNDSREDPLDGYWNSYAGKIGFVCKTVSYPLPEEEVPAETTAETEANP